MDRTNLLSETTEEIGLTKGLDSECRTNLTARSRRELELAVPGV